MLTRSDYHGFIFAILAAIIGGLLVTAANYFYLTENPVSTSKFLTFIGYLVVVTIVLFVVFFVLLEKYFERYFVKD